MNNRLSSNVDYRRNSIKTLRLLAAIQVMWGHMVEHFEVSFPLSGGGISVDQVISWILYFFTGVPLFFCLSGFLIWISIEKYTSCESYFRNRFLRIYPELWTGVAIELVCLLIFVSLIDWKDLILFTVTQATILQFWTPESLRVFGCGTPNGSLWTICVMIQFYIILWPIKKICSGKKANFWIITEMMFILIGAATKYVEGIFPEIMYKLYCNTIVQYLWMFWLGIIIAEYKDIILPLLIKYWYIPALGAILFRFLPVDIWARGYPIIYCSLCLLALIGLAYRTPKLSIRMDISYGLFIASSILALLSTRFAGRNAGKLKIKG